MAEEGLPLPAHYLPSRVDELWQPDTGQLVDAAGSWRDRHHLSGASEDQRSIALLLVDVQNSFCMPGFELFVAGRTGYGAVEDNRRLCAFIYRNLHRLSRIFATMDTHQPYQIFHPCFWTDEDGRTPEPFTRITQEDVARGRWTVHPNAATALGIGRETLQRHARHYTRQLAATGKYDLTIWPYHVLLGSLGHALVPSVQEAVFFHALVRQRQPAFHVKGDNPLTEHYSVLGPEVTHGPDGRPIASRDETFTETLLTFDAVVIAGQAKSHCLAWTIADLLEDIERRDRRLAEKVYVLEDCTSPVVVPGAFDYTEEAEEAFREFARRGMKVVRSEDPMAAWPGMLV